VNVPYRGGAQAVQDVVAGNVGFSMATIASSLSLVQGGRLRALAVSSPTRVPSLPDVPALAEAAIPGFDMAEWIGLFAPAATPPALLDRLHEATLRVLAEPGLRNRLLDSGALPGMAGSRADFARWVAARRAETTALLAAERISAE